MRVDGSYTLNEQSASIYVYLLAFRKTSTNEIVHLQVLVVSIRYSIKKPKWKKRIKINLPWHLWLRVNKDKLPYPVADIEKQMKRNNL